jgi:flagellar hook-length control protein FliK
MKTPGTLWEVFRRRAENPEATARETIEFAHALAEKSAGKNGLSSSFLSGNSSAASVGKVGFEPVPGADQSAMIDRISNITAMSVGKKINNISIELTPPDLGKLQINLALKGGMLHASMKTESQAAHQILQANIDILKDNLAQQGVQVAKIELSLQDDRQRQGWQDNRFAYQEQHDRQRGSYSRERNYSEERTAVEIESASPALVGANSLNVVI